MGKKKVLKELKEQIKILEKIAYQAGYDDGLVEGYDQSDEDFIAGRNVGIKEERERVVELFKMLAQQELVSGSGQKAKYYAMAADTVAVANDLEKLDYSEEALTLWNEEDNERHGF